MIKFDLENGFEGMFHHCHDVWNDGEKKKKHQLHLFAGKKTMQRVPPFVTSHLIAVLGSRPLMNTRPSYRWTFSFMFESVGPKKD